MVQPADLWNGDDRTDAGGKEIDRGCGGPLASDRCVREYWYSQVGSQDATQAGFVQDDDVIETFATNGADQPLGIRVLPG